MLCFPKPSRRSFVGGGLALTLVVGIQVAVLAAPASAAATFNVTSTADIAANAGACGDSRILTPLTPTSLSLREAICLANNNGGTATVNIPSGHYTLTHGHLQVGLHSGQNVTLSGADAASTIIDGNATSGVLDFDDAAVGTIAATVDDLTITGGNDSGFGGAGIIAGSVSAAIPDSLSVTNSVITNNAANSASPNSTVVPGGGIQFIGGSLSISNSVISNNSSKSSSGAGVYYAAQGKASSESLTITGTTFSGNTMTNTDGHSGTNNGGALYAHGMPTTPLQVSGSTFTNNSVVATTGGALGAAIVQDNGVLTVTESNFTGNSVTGGQATAVGGAIDVANGTAAMHYNRFVGNTATFGQAIYASPQAGAVNATDNWFGCNGGPGTTGCDSAVAVPPSTVATAPRLSFAASAASPTVVGPNGTTSVTGSFTLDSGGSTIPGTNLGAFNGQSANFSDPQPSPATVTTPTAAFGADTGTASDTYNSGSSSGSGHLVVGFDNASVTVPITVNRGPTVTTNPAPQSVSVNGTATFTAAASGYPTPTVQWQVSTNGGATYSNVAGATSTTYSLTAAAGDNGNRYRAVFTNVVTSTTTQMATLSVGTAPAFTSSNATTFIVGAGGNFAVTSTGVPHATITKTGSGFPAWLTLTDNGDGTAALAGTPPVGAGGIHTFTLQASNGFSPAASQTFTLSVDEAAAITSANRATFTVGSAGSFAVTTTAGFPTATAITETGALPSGVTLTDNGGGTATLAGTPHAGTGGTYMVTIRAANTAGHTDQSLTLTVREAPGITSADHTTFTTGSAGSFTVTTGAGFPTPSALTESGLLPTGVTFADNGTGAATLAGTPSAGTGGTFAITITASNGVDPDDVQSFTLTVDQPPAVTSVDHTTLTIGTSGAFSVTTTGNPVSALTAVGSLPTGVAFVDNKDGTATLAGTPAAGSNGPYPLVITAGNGVGTDAVQSFTLTVSKAAQQITITSTPPTHPTVNGPDYTVLATSSSNLTVAFTIDASTTSSACSISGATISFDHTGTCVIDADQSGDSTYLAAPKVQQTLSVSAVATAVSVVSSTSPTVYGQTAHATATVTADSGTPAGSVQFAVDGTDLGAPVTVTGGHAVSNGLTGSSGNPLTPGAHPVTAEFTPTDPTTFAGSANSVTQVVNKAATTTHLTVQAQTITAVVAAVAPGVGTPIGSVTFTVNGTAVGSASLVNGVATLHRTVPSGQTRRIAASYGGDVDLTGSSDSTARHDPTIRARVASTHAKTKFGWYRSTVTITFACTPNGARLTKPCPSAVHLTHDGAAQSVTRTISATDGGMDTVVVANINIDTTKPRVRVAGVRDGAIYATAPKLRCVASDARSGIASCRLTRHTSGGTTTYRATATDRAGNTRTVTGTYHSRPARSGRSSGFGSADRNSARHSAGMASASWR